MQKYSNFLHSKKADIKVHISRHINHYLLLQKPLWVLMTLEFDLTIFDEAHRTAGAKESSLFSLALDDNNIPSNKRLFMTATQRMLRPKLKENSSGK